MLRHPDPEGSRSLGVSQNFLTGARTVQRIVSLARLADTDHVIEIGPGKGHITAALLPRCAKVTAVELDGELAAALQAKFAGAATLDLRRDDFLRWPLPGAGRYKVFSNIPFNRTTDIVRKLTEHRNPPEEAWLVMEKGAAKRFLGKPRETLRSLMLKPWFELDVVYHFRREDFHPLPRVDAVLLHLRRKAAPDVPAELREAYGRFIAAGMNRGVTGLAGWRPKAARAAAAQRAGVRPGAAPGDILYVQWLCLYRAWRPATRASNAKT